MQKFINVSQFKKQNLHKLENQFCWRLKFILDFFFPSHIFRYKKKKKGMLPLTEILLQIPVKQQSPFSIPVSHSPKVLSSSQKPNTRNSVKTHRY